jgi:hypothetical protein
MTHSRWEDVKREIREYHAALVAGCSGRNASRLTGWHGGAYHRTRWWWSPPWKVTRPWLPRWILYREGGDEWCNPTILIVLPLMGDVVIRYKRGPLRTKPCDACILESDDHRVCRYCGTIGCPSVVNEDRWP